MGLICDKYKMTIARDQWYSGRGRWAAIQISK